jgi:hypothetical protein
MAIRCGSLLSISLSEKAGSSLSSYLQRPGERFTSSLARRSLSVEVVAKVVTLISCRRSVDRGKGD